jgi:hypothetical protein
MLAVTLTASVCCLVLVLTRGNIRMLTLVGLGLLDWAEIAILMTA